MNKDTKSSDLYTCRYCGKRIPFNQSDSKCGDYPRGVGSHSIGIRPDSTVANRMGRKMDELSKVEIRDGMVALVASISERVRCIALALLDRDRIPTDDDIREAVETAAGLLSLGDYFSARNVAMVIRDIEATVTHTVVNR